MKHKRITITGGKGFLGTHLINKLKERGYKYLYIADLPEYNLINLKDIPTVSEFMSQKID